MHWDFFISYTQPDRPWAEWVAWQLEEAGYSVLLQAWDFVPGSHWTSRMHDGILGAERMIVLLSHAYLRSVYGQAEWQAAFRSDPAGRAHRLVPVRIEDCPRPGLLGGIVSFDLFQLSDEDAKAILLNQIAVVVAGRAKPPAEPPFPDVDAEESSTGPSVQPWFPGRATAGSPAATGGSPAPAFTTVRVDSSPYPLLTAPCGLVGRQVETDQISRFVENTAANADRVMVIRALGGMGKSALAWDFLRSQASGDHRPKRLEAVVWWSFEDGGAVELFEALARVLDAISPGERADLGTVERAFTLIRERRVVLVLDGVERQLAAYSSMPHRPMLDGERRVTPVSVTERRLVDGRIRRLILEVLEGADSRIIMTTRLMPEELEATAGISRRGVMLMDLPPIPPPAVDHLLDSLGAPADALLRSEIERISAGNPLVLQTAASALATGRVDPSSLVSDVAARGIPEATIEGSITAREEFLSLLVSRLDESERTVATVVAAFVESPTTAEVRRVVGRLDREPPIDDGEIEEALGRLNALTLVTRGESGLGERRWSMHPVVRGSVRSIAGTTRSKVLGAIRNEFSDAPDPAVDDVYDLIDLRPQIELFNALCDLDMCDEAARLYLRTLSGPLMRHLKENPRRLQLVGRLFPGGWGEGTAVKDPTLDVGILNEAALTHQWLGQNKIAAGLLRAAMKRSNVDDAHLQSNLASILMYTDDLEDACHSAVVALRLSAQAGDTRRAVITLYYLAIILRQTGRSSQSVLRAIDQLDHRGLPPAWVALRRGDLALWDGRADLALDYGRRSLQAATRLKRPYEPSVIEASRLVGQALVACGRPDQAIPLLEDALRRAGRLVLIQEELAARVALAKAVQIKDPSGAERLLRDGFDHRDPREYRWFAVDGLVVLGEIRQSEGRHREAALCRQQARALARGPSGWAYVLWQTDMADGRTQHGPSGSDDGSAVPPEVSEVLRLLVPR
ncbi:toll/interleukin-1 receptor domain-containing protein [Frankia sp. R43]|uniref:TIR domain-containing protein n=1 Tax=Frankia sp. R43 TaxID=269536 RepID=UPI0007C7056C